MLWEYSEVLIPNAIRRPSILQAIECADGIIRQLAVGSTTDRFWPIARIQHDARKRPPGLCPRAAARCRLDFSLLRNLQRIVHLNAEVTNGAFQLGMTK